MNNFMCEHGGCMSKLSGVELSLLLKQAQNNEIILQKKSTDNFEDSAIINLNKDTYLFSNDFGPVVGNDPFKAGQISALNAISDIYVTGGIPLYALVTLIIEKNTSLDVSSQILSGIRQTCLNEGVNIVGGHTIVSLENIVGLSIIGKTNGILPVLKQGCHSDDWLYITKPIGTGLVLRGFYHGLIDEKICSEAYDVMLESNKIALKIAGVTGIHAMTDITGFGLIGHLSEMLGDKFGAIININSVKFLSSLQYLTPQVMTSQYIFNNISYSKMKHNIKINDDSIFSLALFDPQTNGAILVSADPLLDRFLTENGFTKIGKIISDNTEIIVKNE